VPEDFYVSVDVEADGPIPGPYSMLSLGMASAGRFDGKRYHPRRESDPTFYRELKPISTSFDASALAVSKLDRERLLQEGYEPEVAMREAATWILAEAGSAQPIFVGYPVVFDWLFVYWYFISFVGASPFGFSGALDMKTMYQQKARTLVDSSGRDDLPAVLKSHSAHLHNARADAVEQAVIFGNLFDWLPRPTRP
jgi:hypothetical protein